MSMEREQVCKDCRHCKLTVKKNRTSFRCIEYSAPCYNGENYCTRYQDSTNLLQHQIISYAWGFYEVTGVGTVPKG